MPIRIYTGTHLNAPDYTPITRPVRKDLLCKYIMYNRHNMYFSEERRQQIKEELEEKELHRKVNILRNKLSNKKHSFIKT